MARANPFAGKQAMPFPPKGKGKGPSKKPNPFAKLKEGSPAEEALDKKQDMQGFKKGGRVKKK